MQNGDIQIDEMILQSTYSKNLTNLNWNSTREYKDQVQDLRGWCDWVDAWVLSRGGKVSEMKKYYVNIINKEDNKKLGVHLDHIPFKMFREPTDTDQDWHKMTEVEDTKDNMDLDVWWKNYWTQGYMNINTLK